MTIPRSFEPLLCSLKRLLASMKMSNFKRNYYMANPVLGKSPCSDSFFLGQDFAVRTVSTETVQPVYFCFEAKKKKKAVNIVILHSETTRRS